MSQATLVRLPNFGTYGKYHGDNYGAHCIYFTIGKLTIYYSYQTIVAFHTAETGLVVTQNNWGRTTGKHLTWIDGGKRIDRYPRETFETLLRETLERCGVSN